jgi:putative ABC transport system substrate-binding protein
VGYAVLLDKIWRGARPARLPNEQPTILEMMVNLRTAHALPVAIPKPIPSGADEVIQ